MLREILCFFKHDRLKTHCICKLIHVTLDLLYTILRGRSHGYLCKQTTTAARAAEGRVEMTDKLSTARSTIRRQVRLSDLPCCAAPWLCRAAPSLVSSGKSLFQTTVCVFLRSAAAAKTRKALSTVGHSRLANNAIFTNARLPFLADVVTDDVAVCAATVDRAGLRA